jgi:hypothetical protein
VPGLGLRRRDFRQLQRLLTSHTLCAAESTASLAACVLLRRKTTRLVLFARPPPQHRPALQKKQPPALAPLSPARQNALRAEKQLGATPWGPWRAPSCVPRKWCYWDIFAPFHRQLATTPQHPSGSLGQPRHPPRGGPGPSRSTIQNLRPMALGPWTWGQLGAYNV